MMTLDFSADQQRAVQAVLDWRSMRPRGQQQYLTLGGYAGTGKTTIVSYLVDYWGDAATVALCGKAAHVLRTKGSDAQTIHSLVYVPYKNAQGQTRFRKRDWLEGRVGVIVVDEASMIDHLLLQDLLSFQIPVLFVGDHGQLEPIGTNPRLMHNPKIRLETIHRQAMDNPILRLATAFREGRTVPQWCDPKGRLQVRNRREFYGLIEGQQVICGFNKTRHEVNRRIRKAMGLNGDLVGDGEKLICLKNNKSWNIFNGQQVTTIGIHHEDRRTIDIEIETDDGRIFTIPCHKAQFGADAIADFKPKDIALMDYGYCLTAHKSQGSEWDEVIALEEISSHWDARRWRYTVATRAKERLVYCA